MNVTHILRGEEFISSTPKYLSVYEVLGFTPPVFVTLPSILRDDKTKKLGKRDGAKDVLEYRTEGYLPEAMTNILALIGWNPGTEKEVFTMKELILVFDIAQVQKSGGVFNEDKLNWFNREHIALLSDNELVARLKPFMSSSGSSINSRTLPLIREKITILSDAQKLFDGEGELAFIAHISDYPADMLLWKKNPDKESTKKHLTAVLDLIQKISDENPDVNFTAESIKTILWPYVEANGKGDVLWPLRVSITGQDKSPDPFVSASLLGKTETVKRIQDALRKLS
jgi:glutamyl/glutaminyl-tRNA synthetase